MFAQSAIDVSDEQVREFEENGVVCLRGIVGEDWRAAIAEAIERDIRDPGPFVHNYDSDSGRFHGNSMRWPVHPEFRRYVFDSPLPNLAARFLRARRVNLLYDQIFAKEPSTPTPTPWHMDHVVWQIDGFQVISFWLTLDPVTAETGAMRFVRGSHKWRKFFQPRSFSKSSLDYSSDGSLEEVPDIEADPDQYEILTWEMDPGDLLVFTSFTLHGAGGNSSQATRRRGYTVRYTGDDVTYAPRPNTMPVLDNPRLAPGEPLDSPMFPVVWRHAGEPEAGNSLTED